MAPFDPYHKWLAIPPEDQPANHYRLLGLPQFESDADVIETTAERQTLLLRTFQTGPNSELAERLLNEVSAARVCLLDGKSKARYDTQLKATLEATPEDDPLAFTTEELAAVSSKPSTRQGSRSRSRGGKPFWQEPWAIRTAVGGIVVVLLLIMLIFGSGEEPKESGQGQEQELQAEIASLKEKLVAAGNSKAVGKSLPAGSETLPAKVAVAPPLAVAPFDTAQAKAHQQAWSKHLGVPIEYTNSIGMKFMLIPPGEFMMGSPESEEGHREDELPHHVRLTKPFYLGSCEVTVGQHSKVMAGRLSKSSTDDLPVLNASWHQAVSFAYSLSNRPEEKGVKNAYRLPAEAEWEYACRAGTTTMYSFGDDPKHLGDYGWFRENSGAKAHPVGKKKPNRWGLYDMHGNVWEWYWQWQTDKSYASTINSPGSLNSSFRGIRGGCWFEHPHQCRSPAKMKKISGFKHDRIGFRVVLEIPVRAQPNTIAAETKSLPASLQQGLVAYYPFNGNLEDESGNGHHGEAKNVLLTRDRHGDKEKAFYFAGKGQHVSLPPFQYGSRFSVSIWANSFTESDIQIYFSKKPNELLQSVQFYENHRGNGHHYTATVFSSDNLSIGRLARFLPDAPGNWSHLIFTYDGGNTPSALRIYKNGIRADDFAERPIESQPGSFAGFNDLNVHSEIGSQNQGKQSFHGFLDDVRIYNRALSEQEVRQLYEFESSGTAAAATSDKLYLATLRPERIHAHLYIAGGSKSQKPLVVNGQEARHGILVHPRTRNEGEKEVVFLASGASLGNQYLGQATFDVPAGYHVVAGAVAVGGGKPSATKTIFQIVANDRVLWESNELPTTEKIIGFCLVLDSPGELKMNTICSHHSWAHAFWLDPVLLKSTGGKSLEEIAKEQQARWLKKEE